MKRKLVNKLFIEPIKADVKSILADFDEVINSKPIEVCLYDIKGEIKGTRRVANELDRLEYIEEEWYRAKEKLSELGIIVTSRLIK